MPPQLSLSRPLPVTSCVDAGLDSLCTKQDVASFRIQYIGVEGERIGPKAFGSGVQSLLVPSGYCYPRTFGDEQLRGCQSYSAIAARDQGGFTLKLHWILLLLGLFISSACLQIVADRTRRLGEAASLGGAQRLPPNTLSLIAAIEFPKYRQRKPGSRSISSRRAACKNDWV